MRVLLAGGLAPLSLVALPSMAAAHADGTTEVSAPALTQGHTSKLADLRDVTAPHRSGPGAPWTTQVFDRARITCIEDRGGRGAMGIHFVDVGNLVDGQVERHSPEALIYEPGAGGSLTLVGAEYLVFADAWDAENAAPPILYGQRFARVAAGNRYDLLGATGRKPACCRAHSYPAVCRWAGSQPRRTASGPSGAGPAAYGQVVSGRSGGGSGDV